MKIKSDVNGVGDFVSRLLGGLGHAAGHRAGGLAHFLAAVEVLAVGAALDAVVHAVEGGYSRGRGRHEDGEDEEHGDDSGCLGSTHFWWMLVRSVVLNYWKC